MDKEFKRGDYVKCDYEGREYIGHLTESPKKNIAKVKICLSSKRAEAPIFDIVDVNLKNISKIIED